MAYSKFACTKKDSFHVYGVLTGAADVAADGYTVTDDGGGIIASAARSAEGAITITLDRAYEDLLWINCVNTRADSLFVYVSNAVSSAGTIAVKFTEAAAAKDPDGATILVELVLKDIGASAND